MIVTIEKIENIKIHKNNFMTRSMICVDKRVEKYPVPIKFEVIQESCNDLDNLNKGDIIDVEFNITGNRWTNPKGEEQIFNGLRIWSLKLKDA